VRVTHPFRPWAGREFTFIDRRLAWDEDRVALADENGEVVSLPAAWTEVGMQVAGPLTERLGARVVVPAGAVLCGAARDLPRCRSDRRERQA
jgi:hypothetical protein